MNKKNHRVNQDVNAIIQNMKKRNNVSLNENVHMDISSPENTPSPKPAFFNLSVQTDQQESANVQAEEKEAIAETSVHMDVEYTEPSVESVKEESADSALEERKQEVTEEKSPLTWQENITLYIHDIVLMMSVVLVVFMLLFRIIVVSGPSMKQTLLDGDYLLLLNNLFYQEPRYGDVVVVSKHTYDDGKPLVKRVIATEGQIVDIDFNAGVVFVDGEQLEETYVNTPTNLQEGMAFPLIVDEGCVFVLGDNRNNSKDSRSVEIGQVDKRELLGKVFLLVMPGTDHGQQKKDFGRLGGVK